MASTLVVNTGSSSKKYALFNAGREKLSVSVTIESVGALCVVQKAGVVVQKLALSAVEYREALRCVLEAAKQYGCITADSDIERVAIRIVAPGSQFQEHTKIDDAYIQALQKRREIAPLHIPPILDEIAIVWATLPEACVVAVSDSAFHSMLPSVAQSYSIPPADAAAYDIKRFGYHGISVESVLQRLPRVYDADISRCIICHLGSGMSVTAVRDGSSIDTSMGFSPGSGLPMASRAGDLDAGALLALLQSTGMGPDEAYTYIQTRGGVSALSGETDLRHVLERYAVGDADATAALEHVAYYVKKYIGAYLAVLGGIDVLVFTATAGERSPVLREMCVRDLESIGLQLDHDRNQALIGADGMISRTNSPVPILVVQTKEMATMARIANRV